MKILFFTKFKKCVLKMTCFWPLFHVFEHDFVTLSCNSEFIFQPFSRVSKNTKKRVFYAKMVIFRHFWQVGWNCTSFFDEKMRKTWKNDTFFMKNDDFSPFFTFLEKRDMIFICAILDFYIFGNVILKKWIFSLFLCISEKAASWPSSLNEKTWESDEKHPKMVKSRI